MIRQQEDQEKISDQDIWSGRMSPEHSQATKEKTSGQSLKKLQKSRIAQYQSLCLKRINGMQPDASWATITPSHGECWMLNTSESPNEEKESTLSQILKVTPHMKYYLSKTACEGILKRAAKRGKVLPAVLEMALKKQIRCFDIGDRRRVADQSEMSPTLTQKMGTGGNNVPIILENHAQDSRVDICKDGTVPTLTTRMGTGGGNVPMVMETRAFHLTQDPISMKISPCLTQGNPNAGQATIGVVIPIADKHSVAYSIDRAAFNQGMNAKYDIGITKDIAQTIHGTYAMQGFGDYKSSDTASSIKQRDFKDATDLVVAFEPGTVSRIGGHFYEDGKTGTLRAKPGDNQQTIISEYIVRRLTPTECGRLQGFPDGWADNLAIENPTEDDILYWQMVFKEHSKALGISKKEKTDNQIRKWLQNPESDSAKYKLWGNGIALPCAMMVMEGIVKVMKERDGETEFKFVEEKNYRSENV